MSRRFRGKRGLMSVTANFGDRSSVTVKPLRDAPGKYASNHYPTGIILAMMFATESTIFLRSLPRLGTPRGGF